MNGASLLGVCVTAALQSALLALAVAAILFVCRHADATTRHRVWFITLVASVALPVVDLVVRSTPAAPAVASALARPNALTSFVLSPRLVAVALALWAAASLVSLFRLGWSFVALERLRRSTQAVAPELEADVQAWARRIGIARRVAARTSSRLASPIAIGLFAPLVVIPERLLSTLAPADIECIFVHELAHLRRRDDLTNLLARVARAVFVFNPVLPLIERRIAVEREIACDDWVVATLGRARHYARCLAHVLLSSPGQTPAPGYLHFFRSPEHSVQRIEMLLAPPPPARLLFVNAALVSAAATITLGIATAASTPQLVAFDLPFARVIGVAQLDALRQHVLVPATIVIATAAPQVDRAFVRALERVTPEVAYRSALVAVRARPMPLQPPPSAETLRFAAARDEVDTEAARDATVERDASSASEVGAAVTPEMTRAALAARFGVGAPITPARVPALALSYNSYVMAPVGIGATTVATGGGGGGGGSGSGSLDGTKLPGGGVGAPAGSHPRGDVPGQRKIGP